MRSTPLVRLVNPAAGTPAVPAARTRQLTLNEVMAMPRTAVDPVTGVLTAYPGGPLEILVNNTKWDGMRVTGVDTSSGMPMYIKEPIPGFVPDGCGNYLSEVPREGDTEIWEIVNLTADAHPIHLHLVQFQLVNRQSFDVAKYTAVYDASFPAGGHDPMSGQPYAGGVYVPGWGPPLNYEPSANPLSGGKHGGNPDVGALSLRGKPLYLQGKIQPPLPHEAGWKDTVIMYPGQVTRIAVRWAPTELPANTPPDDAFFPFDPSDGGRGGYVWHCHIVDHEDNEMMRPDMVVPNPDAVRTCLQGIHY